MTSNRVDHHLSHDRSTHGGVLALSIRAEVRPQSLVLSGDFEDLNLGAVVLRFYVEDSTERTEVVIHEPYKDAR